MSIDYTRLHSSDSEQSVLGAMLIPGSNAVDRIGQLKPGHFFTEAHRMIFAEIVAMAAQGIAVDPVTVAERLETAGLSEKAGGLAYLGDLANNTPSAANVGRYAQVVVDKALERELLAAADQIQAIASGIGSTKDKLAAAQSAVMAISEAAEPRRPQLIRDVLIRAVTAIERRGTGQDGGMHTGFPALDALLSGGFRRGNLVIVAGRPGMGKTAFAGGIALNAAAAGVPTLFLSMEMADTELADRMIAVAGRVPLDDILAGNMAGDAGDRILKGTARLHELPLVIDEQGCLSLFEIASKARSVKRQHGLGLLVIDYIQLAAGDGKNRQQRNRGHHPRVEIAGQGIADSGDCPVAAFAEVRGTDIKLFARWSLDRSGGGTPLSTRSSKPLRSTSMTPSRVRSALRLMNLITGEPATTPCVVGPFFLHSKQGCPFRYSTWFDLEEVRNPYEPVRSTLDALPSSNLRHIKLDYVFWENMQDTIAAPLFGLGQTMHEVSQGLGYTALRRLYRECLPFDQRGDLEAFMGDFNRMLNAVKSLNSSSLMTDFVYNSRQ